jgi:putative Holliday junction resolvase
MSILGIDYGRKRIGLALSDDQASIALAFGIIDAAKPPDVVAKLKDIIQVNHITEIVLGLPKRMDNTLGQSAQEVNSFAEQLKLNGIDVPVTFWDERLSSKQAEVLLRDTGLSHKHKREHINVVAAQLVLQSYLDSRKHQVSGS